MSRAVVFAYHDVGVRCLKVLLAQGVDVRLVITHTDNPTEQIWFDSVADTATAYGVPVLTPTDAQLQAQGVRVEVNGAVTTFARADASDPAHCSFTYTQATDARTAAVLSTPVVHGC